MLTLIKLDGQIVGVTDPQSQGAGLTAWFHREKPSCSMDHALTHEGYELAEVDEIDCHEVAGIIEQIAARLGVTMEAAFVPFSLSRNKAEKHLSLNWTVTLKRHGRTVLTSDYMQGLGHAPADQRKAVAKLTPSDRRKAETIYAEKGRRVAMIGGWSMSPGKPLDPPRLGDVLQCLVGDAQALDYAGFEAWAAEYGYDTDSRSAERIYQSCMDTATKLRSALGAPALDEMQIVASFN